MPPSEKHRRFSALRLTDRFGFEIAASEEQTDEGQPIQDLWNEKPILRTGSFRWMTESVMLANDLHW